MIALLFTISMAYDYLNGRCEPTPVEGTFQCVTRKDLCFVQNDYFDYVTNEKYIRFSCHKGENDEKDLGK
jgi:hypothetical protein